MVQDGATSGKGETYLNLNGSDNTTGFAWPIRAWNGTSQIQSLAYNGYKSLLDGSKAHSGSRSLYQEVTTGHTADGGTYNQLAFLWNPANSVDQQKDVYFSAWYYLQPDLADKLVYTPGGGPMSNGLWGDWRAFFEIKTGGAGTDWRGDLRHIVYIMKNSSGGLHWELNVDRGDYPCGTACWPARVKNTTVPVPVGQWFKFETFLHRSSGQDGRWLVKVNGQTLVDRYGPNIGSQNSPINRIFLSQVYSNGKAPQYQWVDDIEIYNAMPY